MKWHDVTSLAERQHGLVAWQQLAKVGWTWRGVAHAVEQGRLTRVRTGVYRVAGTPSSRLTALMAATLATRDRGVVSRRAAAVDLWGVPDLTRTNAVDLLLRRPVDLDLPGVLVSTTDHLPWSDQCRRFGVPTLRFPRLVVELAAVLHPGPLGQVLDFGLRRRLLTLPALSACFEAWCRPGRRGITRLRSVLGERTERYRVPDSTWEDDTYRRLRRAGLPAGERWYRVELPSGRTAWVDVAYPAAKVALELDSYEWHGQRTFFDDDAEGRGELAALGWLVVPATSTMAPARVVARVLAALGARAA